MTDYQFIFIIILMSAGFAFCVGFMFGGHSK